MPTLSFGGLAPWSKLKGPLLGRVEREEEKKVQINIQNTLEYLEGGNQVSPKSSPLQEMKDQLL